MSILAFPDRLHDGGGTTRRQKEEGTGMKAFLVKMTLLIVPAAALQAQVRDAQYPDMAPIEQYLMARDAEVAMARSAAPESLSRDAEIMILGRQGYETAIKGKNGFVCMVERSWAAGIDDPEFWNPRLRGPICFNPAAVRSHLPLIVRKTKLAMAGNSKARLFDDIKTAFDSKQLPTPEPGSIGYMMSKQGYLNDRDGHWHPHLMFFLPVTDPAAWGADLPGSPIIGYKDAPGYMTVFLIPVGKWSDGAAAPLMEGK
jgi:hypothetical protein